MNALWVILEILVNIFQGVMLSYYAYAFLGDKSNKSYFKSEGLIFAGLLAVALTILNHIILFEHFFAIIYMLIIFIYAAVYLNGSIMKKLFAAIFPLLILLILSAFLANFFAILFGVTQYEIFAVYNINRLIAVLTIQVMVFYVYRLTLKIFRKDKGTQVDLTAGEWLLISIVLLLSIIIAAFLSLISLSDIQHIYRAYIVFSFIGLVLINVTTFFTILKLSKKNETVKENELLKLQNIYNKQLVSNVKAEYETIKKLRHDFKDTFGVISTLLSEGKVEKAIKYVEENKELLNQKETFVHTENDIVNAVINSKLSFAKSFGIEISCLSASDFSGVNDTDLCTLLSNMLENAVAACLKIQNGDKYIYLKISFDGVKYNFNIKNTIDKPILGDNPNLETTKKNAKNHGYGVKIIRDIASKYNGGCDFYEENNFFCCNVILNK